MSVHQFPAKPFHLYVHAVEWTLAILTLYYTCTGVCWFNTVKEDHGTESD